MAVLGCAVSTAWAQAIPGEAIVSKGLRADRSYFSPLPFEHFDPMSGNVVLTFTDLELPGNAGRSLRFTRTYNSQSAPGGETPGYQHGYWTFGISGLVVKVIDKAAPTPLNPLPSPPALANVPAYTRLTPLLVGSDGGARTTFYYENPSQTSLTTQDSVITTEGFIKYQRSTGVMKYPDGILAQYQSSFSLTTGQPSGTGRLVHYSDQYGNLVELIPDGNVVTVRQTLGPGQIREVTLTLNGEGLPVSMVYEGRTWLYEYSDSQVGYEPGYPVHVQQHVLETVTLPNSQTWQFGYESDHQWFVTPQGGRVDYHFESGSSQLDDQTLYWSRLASRESSDSAGSWGINIGGSGTNSYSAITTPEGQVITYHFQDLVSTTGVPLTQKLNRTEFIGGLFPREDGANAPNQQVLPGAA